MRFITDKDMREMSTHMLYRLLLQMNVIETGLAADALQKLKDEDRDQRIKEALEKFHMLDAKQKDKEVV